MVDKPLTMSFNDLMQRPMIDHDVTLTCVSESVGGGLAGNARWQGTLLADVLRKAGVKSGAQQIVMRDVNGMNLGVALDPVMDGRKSLLAVGMNGQPLPPEHGFPVRVGGPLRRDTVPRRSRPIRIGHIATAGLTMDGGQQGGIAADQGRVLQREQRAVRLAALPDPLVGNVHRLDPVHRNRAESGLGLAVQVAVQAGEGPDQFLGGLRATMGPGDALLIGADLVKEPRRLVRAYDDARGVTADFNRNVLRVINRELDADFDVSRFAHVAIWDNVEERIEMRLRSTRAQTVRVGALDLVVEFAAGEEMRTEISAKFTRERFEASASAAGLRIDRWWTDRDGDFVLCLVRPAL